MSSCALWYPPGTVLLLSLFEPRRDLTDTFTAHFHQLISFVMLASHYCCDIIMHDIKCKLLSLPVLFSGLPTIQLLMAYSTQRGRPGPFYNVDYVMSIGRRRGEGVLNQKNKLKPFLAASIQLLEFRTFTMRKTCCLLFGTKNTCTKCVLSVGDHLCLPR